MARSPTSGMPYFLMDQDEQEEADKAVQQQLKPHLITFPVTPECSSFSWKQTRKPPRIEASEHEQYGCKENFTG